jgi:hypothetical protein
MTSHPVPLTPASCPTDITSCPHNITSCSTDITSCPSNITSCPPDATSCHMPSPRMPRPRADLTSCPCGRDPRELAAEAVEREAHSVEDIASHVLHQHRTARLDGIGPGLVPAGSGVAVTSRLGAGPGMGARPGLGAGHGLWEGPGAVGMTGAGLWAGLSVVGAAVGGAWRGGRGLTSPRRCPCTRGSAPPKAARTSRSSPRGRPSLPGRGLRGGSGGDGGRAGPRGSGAGPGEAANQPGVSGRGRDFRSWPPNRKSRPLQEVPTQRTKDVALRVVTPPKP